MDINCRAWKAPCRQSAMAATTVVVVAFPLIVVLAATAAVVEHHFVVSQIGVNHLCKDTLVTLVNGQFPGPTIEAREGDAVAIHVINKSPHQVTIHWHGLKQRLNCWADGVGMITQCPIPPGKNFTYRFNVTGQEGTLWWHAHVTCLRGTLHGALVIRPRSGPSSYPFPKPDKEIPIVIGEWWEMDLAQLHRRMSSGFFDDNPRAATINGKLGDLYNCSGKLEDSYILNVESGKTYLLRMVNAALFSEYYFKIAGHKLTVVAADANYVKPYTTDTVAIAPGESMDVLVTADAPPEGRYYMVVLANQPWPPDPQIPVFRSRGIVQYKGPGIRQAPSSPPMAPDMPDQHDTISSFYFHGNLTSLPHPLVPPLPAHVDEHMLVTLGLGSICREGYGHGTSSSCKRRRSNETIVLATMNNVSFLLPAATAVPLLEAHYNDDQMSGVDTLQELPDRPPRLFNFTDEAMIPPGRAEERLEPTTKATAARWFRYNSSVEIVFQSTALLQSDSNPMHLHGHDFYVLAQGLGNYDAERDTKAYNLVDPPLRNTVLVPRVGWAAIRFVTDNPGVWFLHCHFDFHLSMGMAAAFVVGNGPTVDAALPPPPVDLPRCDLARERLEVTRRKGGYTAGGSSAATLFSGVAT